MSKGWKSITRNLKRKERFESCSKNMSMVGTILSMCGLDGIMNELINEQKGSIPPPSTLLLCYYVWTISNNVLISLVAFGLVHKPNH